MSSVSDDAPWLTVTAQDVDGDGLGTYLATVDRGGLDDGTYSATISITSTAGTLVASRGHARGRPDDRPTPASSTCCWSTRTRWSRSPRSPLRAVNGGYAYAFHDMPPGNYAIVAGSDMDDDGFICDGGEACGSYPTLDLPDADRARPRRGRTRTSAPPSARRSARARARRRSTDPFRCCAAAGASRRRARAARRRLRPSRAKRRRSSVTIPPSARPVLTSKQPPCSGHSISAPESSPSERLA